MLEKKPLGYTSQYVGVEPFKIFAIKPQTILIFQAILVCVRSFLPIPMDYPTAFYSNFSSFFSSFVYAHLIPILLAFLLCSCSLLLIRLKPFLGFFLSFFHPNHQNIQATLVIEEYRNQELFGSTQTYITYKLLPSVEGVVKITKPKHSNTLIWDVGQDQEIPDSFRGVPLKWVLRVRQENGLIGRFRKSRYFELCVPKEHLAEVRSVYLQSHVLEEAARIRRNNMILRRRRRRQHQQRRNNVRVGWVNVIAGLLIQLMG